MNMLKHWAGVRLRTVEIGSDPDAPLRRVAIPAVWEDRAAAGFVGICGDRAPGWAPLRLPDAAAAAIERLAAAGRVSGAIGDAGAFVDGLHGLLLLRQGCADTGAWRADGAGGHGFVLNLAAFADPETGFDEAGLRGAVALAAVAAAAAGGGDAIRIADVDGMLARLGLDYDSEAGRSAARDVVSLVRAGARTVPVSAGAAGWADALLGVETAGFAPAYSAVGEDGLLTLAAQARLAALGLSPERALATVLDGGALLERAGLEAHAAMHDVLAPLLASAPARPAGAPRLAAASERPAFERLVPVRRALPARSKGFTQKVTIGGHRLFLRTAEYGDGTLGEVAITLAGRDGGAARGMADAVATAMSIALQHGVPLDAFVDAFAHVRFGAGGAVEGDPAILSASSPLDYVVRALADAYLGRHLADPATEEHAEPLLPLGLGDEAGGAAVAGGMRQRALRLVSPA